MGPKKFKVKKLNKNNLGSKKFKVKKFALKKFFWSKIFFWVPKKFGPNKKNKVQKYSISYGSLSLKCHAILLARSGVMGFVSIERVERESSIG